MLVASSNVRVRQHSGRYVLLLSSSQFDPIAEVVGLKGVPYTFVSFRGLLRSIEPLIAIVLGCMCCPGS
jgi:hypothetical protein